MAPTPNTHPLAAAAAAAAAAAPLLLPRQLADTASPPANPIETTTIPAHYGSLHSGPDPGTVAGITLGSVAGFILLLWLLYTCINLGNPSAGGGGGNDTSTVVTEGTASVYTRRRRNTARSRAAGGGGKRETVEVRRGPVVVEDVSSVGVSEVDRVIIEERRRSVSRPRYARPHPHPHTPRRVVSSESGGEDDEDEVVVIEEHSPPPRARRQRSRVRSVERRSGGFREVDPERFAGGDGSFVEVRRSGSRR
jgi:hypothetical protein